jgi:hypothetical protein
MQREIIINGQVLEAKIGDYVTVTGKSVNGNQFGTWQGVLVRMHGKDKIYVRGEIDNYVCDSTCVVVPDKNLIGDTIEFVNQLRSDLGISNYYEK